MALGVVGVSGPRPFADHFSGFAAEYVRARPTYPEELFDELAARCPHHRWAWDVGCGNGQASAPLSSRFERVIGSEPSLAQLAQVPAGQRGRFVAAPAEAAIFDRPVFDLVVAAQAAHWFDMERFAVAVRRAACPGALVAVWCYRTLVLDQKQLDGVVEDFYANSLGDWWPAGREHIDTGYRSLTFPFEELESPLLEMTRDWSLRELVAYLDTWSAVRRKRLATGIDPLAEVEPLLSQYWGQGQRRVRWPLGLRLGRV